MLFETAGAGAGRSWGKEDSFRERGVGNSSGTTAVLVKFTNL